MNNTTSSESAHILLIEDNEAPAKPTACHRLTKPVIHTIVYGKGRRTPREVAMNVSLTAELEKFVNAKVQTGRYNSASEVVREALRLLEEHEQARAAQTREFNKELGRRLAALDCGDHVDPEEARARLQRKSEDRRKKRA